MHEDMDRSLASKLSVLADAGLDDAELDLRVARFQAALHRVRADPAEAERIASLVADAENARPYPEGTWPEGSSSQRRTQRSARRPGTRLRAPRRWPWGLRATVGSILALAVVGGLAAGLLARPPGLPMIIFLAGALMGFLTGGAVCVHYLRLEIAAGVAPRLRLMQLHLEALEAEVNLALAAKVPLDPMPDATRTPAAGWEHQRDC